MADIFVGRLMSSPVQTIARGSRMNEAAQLMVDHGIGSLVVVNEENHLEGILTATDFVRISANGESVTDTTVDTYMTTDVITTTANESIRDIADTMIENGFHHVPVVDETEGVVGMITTTDLTSYLSHVETPQRA